MQLTCVCVCVCLYSQDEIVPVKTKVVDPKSGAAQEVVISKDDGIRPGATAESLSSLKAVFKKDGSTTAGNSSQVRDALHTCVCVCV